MNLWSFRNWKKTNLLLVFCFVSFSLLVLYLLSECCYYIYKGHYYYGFILNYTRNNFSFALNNVFVLNPTVSDDGNQTMMVLNFCLYLPGIPFLILYFQQVFNNLLLDISLVYNLELMKSVICLSFSHFSAGLPSSPLLSLVTNWCHEICTVHPGHHNTCKPFITPRSAAQPRLPICSRL